MDYEKEFEHLFNEDELRSRMLQIFRGRQRMVLSEVVRVCRIVGLVMFRHGVQYGKFIAAPKKCEVTTPTVETGQPPNACS